MKIHPEGVAVTLTLPFVDLNGDLVVPTAASVRVLDEAGAELAPETEAPFEVGDTDLTVTIPAVVNTLDPTLAVGLRVVELALTTDAGTVTTVTRYALRRGARLALMVNSFQTYDQALLLALDMPRMDGWELNPEPARAAALIEAYERLIRLGYIIPEPAHDIQAVLDPRYAREISPTMWRIMTAEQFMSLYPECFRTALRKAQIVEADVILNGDVITGRRRAGLMSESIGESSMMFRPGKPLDLGVSPEALAHLTGYVDISVRIGR